MTTAQLNERAHRLLDTIRDSQLKDLKWVCHERGLLFYLAHGEDAARLEDTIARYENLLLAVRT